MARGQSSIEIDVEALAVAVQEDEIAIALQPFQVKLDALLAAAPQFQNMLDAARQTK